ncbi:AAA family ATPase [Mycobacterium dioxanotrophicus]|uniref:AAA family ATPase n=1 Tax=Mycobacterium dioxanotrophicus TaxID=482462 RepID=UPI0018DFC927|nr:AAA family ATPase [Mycobacterium dioxanotrophicus]
MTEPHPDDPGPVDPDMPTRRLIVTRGSRIKAKKLVWWELGLILQYAINLLAAREGKGKSTVASSWAARETRNGGTVLWIGTEESRESAIVTRLIAAGADMDKVIFVDVQTDLGTGALVFPLDLNAIEDVIREHNVTMVFLDPAKAVVPPGFSGNDDIAVRQYLEPIAALADRCKVTIIGLAHFGKRDGADSGQLMLGSVAWSQVARCVLSIAEDPDTGTRVLTNTKANYAGTDRSVEFRIVSTTVDTDDGPTEIGSVEWLGDTTVDARDLLAGDAHDDDAGERTAAEHWLEDYLTANGPTPSKVVKTEAAKEKISEATLKRAKKKLGVIDESSGFPRTSTWQLPSRLTASQATPVTQDREPTEPTGPDQPKQDEPTEPEPQSAHANMSEPTGDPTGPSPATMPARQFSKPARNRHRTISGKPISSYPTCIVCSKPVVAGQGDRHLSCGKDEAAS